MDAYWLKKDLAPAFEYTRALTSHYAKSFYFSARFLPPERRWGTYALYGFCRYADNLIDLPRERTRDQLLMEIAHLEEELSVAYETGESEHPILKPFVLVAHKYNIPLEYPRDLLKGVEMDVRFNGYDTFQDLYVFCYRVAGVVGLMMTYILGYNDKAAFPYAEKLGIAMQLTNILRDIQEDKEMGRIYLPREELRQFGISEADLFDERMTEDMHALMRFQIERAHNYYKEADPGIALLRRESRFAIYSASRIYRGILHKIELADYNPFQGRAFVPTRRKFGILLHELLRRR